MPSPEERLGELRRQRALLQEHLAFLDREITAASGGATVKTTVETPQPGLAALPEHGTDVAAVIESFEAESHSDLAKAKSGCIWIFVAGLVLFALCLFAFYLHVRHHQSLTIR
jgi:hypothetical protein